MRISTQQIFEIGAARIGDLQARLQKTQDQISTGRRILTASDDPVGATRALEITQSQSVNNQYGVNRMYAKNTLSQAEVTLEGVTELFQDVKTAIISARNGVLNDSQRGYHATELSGRLQQLLGLANTRDESGNYLFSGFQTNTPAFVQTATGATYQGDLGQKLIQVDATRQMASNTPGSTVFQGGAPGGAEDVFKTLTDLVNLLQTPVVTPADSAALAAGLATASTNMDLALDNVLTTRAAMGTRLQEIDSLDSLGEDRDLQYSQALSAIQDLDYTQAITQLSQQKVTLEAAQQSFVQTSKLSLFNYI
jgi:flagellar hook-associated protein 3 FlgL